jgi:hypothetical protein
VKFLRHLLGFLTYDDLVECREAVFPSGVDASVLEELRAHPSLDAFVAGKFRSRGLRIPRGGISSASRIVAGDIHAAGQALVLERSGLLQGVSPEQLERRYLAIHPFVWGASLAEQIQAQAWGHLGQDRKHWIREDARFNTNTFGVDAEFVRIFANPAASPLYAEFERPANPVGGAIYVRCGSGA